MTVDVVLYVDKGIIGRDKLESVLVDIAAASAESVGDGVGAVGVDVVKSGCVSEGLGLSVDSDEAVGLGGTSGLRGMQENHYKIFAHSERCLTVVALSVKT